MPAIDLAAIHDTGYQNTDNITSVGGWSFDVTGLAPSSAYAISAYTPNGRRTAYYNSTAEGTFQFAVNAGTTQGSYRFVLFSSVNPNPEAELTVTYDLTAPTPAITPSTLRAEDKAYVDFQVSYGEPVVGVDAGDFALHKAGVSASVISRTLVQPGVWQVRVKTGIEGEDGYIAVNIPAGATVADYAGNAAGAPVTGPRVRVINYNQMVGGPRPDRMVATSSMDMIKGGGGLDTVAYARSPRAVTVDLSTGTGRGGHAEGDRYKSIENVHGSNYHDNLRGNRGPNEMKGGPGNDKIFGGDGIDRIYGGPGSNKLDGGPGIDKYFFSSFNDIKPGARSANGSRRADPPPTEIITQSGEPICLCFDVNQAAPGFQTPTLTANNGAGPITGNGQIQITIDAATKEAVATLQIRAGVRGQFFLMQPTLLVPRVNGSNLITR